MKRPREKDPRKLMALAARLAEAKRTLSAVDFEAFKHAEPELRHEARPEEVTVDKAERLIRLFSMPVILDNLDKLPRTGWATLRELSKLSEATLRALFACNAIGPWSYRENINQLRAAQTSKTVAPRHPGPNPEAQP
jgi:hypothetical protein